MSFRIHEKNGDGLRRIFAVSDLHIGAPYSGWRQQMSLVKEGIRLSDETVLCGDIFEGTCGFTPLRQRIAMAKQQLEEMAKTARDSGTIIHLLEGNHENPRIKGGTPEDAPYLEVWKAVKQCAAAFPDIIKLQEKGWVRIGDTVFTHGHRETNFIDHEPSLVRNIIELPFNVGLPPTIANWLIGPKEGPEIKIYQAFADEQELKGSAVSHIVSGHTHEPTPIRGIRKNGLTLGNGAVHFHNLGAALWSAEDIFRPLLLMQDKNGVTRNIIGKKDMLGGGHTR